MNNRINGRIYWSRCSGSLGSIHLAATEAGLVFAGSLNGAYQELEAWIEGRFRGYTAVRDDSKLQPYTDELEGFFQGGRRTFTLPLELPGTPFQKDVWDALRCIPYGETRSYTDIASLLGKPSSVRAVAAAIGANPALIFVPCHRVIGKNGSLTGYRGGLRMKEELIRHELTQTALERSLERHV
ncbi:methylated-DNA--[protein]-cysteine S-methyltransferase [Paenibacillus tarimensis]|uniref:methylated-DNA--[protein]-cysteine S-methyltransferase n=1 Tax=Paenibacillus tarimensis TaxID=416012 RepID=UPI001F24BE2A|nr:methylated-DNA--[protein]-cysteine S-methyltransferase [Paenibacillus tarimensis]MCF2945529.1 methylated-DNA--[protein]-cysteine S-methyltransferase [Paenibacillus tarimensis]